MIYIKIGNEERQFNFADEQWISQQINRRRQDGVPVCAQVRIRQGDINLTLRTPGCTSTGGGGQWNPNQTEHRIYELWLAKHLDELNFAPGELISFLKQISRAL